MACRLLEQPFFHRHKITISVSYFNSIWRNNIHTHTQNEQPRRLGFDIQSEWSVVDIMCGHLLSFPVFKIHICLSNWQKHESQERILQSTVSSRNDLFSANSIIGLIRFRFNYSEPMLNYFPHIYQEQEVSTIFHHHLYVICNIFHSGQFWALHQ